MHAWEVRAGDVIEYPSGINRDLDIVTIHHVHTYATGDLSIRYRYTSNPRGIDWSGFIAVTETGLRLLSRGVAQVHSEIRSLLA